MTSNRPKSPKALPTIRLGVLLRAPLLCLALSLLAVRAQAQAGLYVLNITEKPIIYTQSSNPPFLVDLLHLPDKPAAGNKPATTKALKLEHVSDVSFSFMGQPLTYDTLLSLPAKGLYYVHPPYIPYDTTRDTPLSISYILKDKAQQLSINCQVQAPPLPVIAVYVNDKPDSITDGNQTVELRLQPHAAYAAQCPKDAKYTLARVKLGLQVADLPPQPFDVLSFGPGQTNCPIKLGQLWQAYQMTSTTKLVLYIDELKRTTSTGIDLQIAPTLPKAQRIFTLKRG